MSDNQHITTKYGTGLKTYKSYVIGLILSVILTLLAFTIVAKHMLDDKSLYITLTLLALMQLFAQVVFFLRLNTSSEGKWNSMPFLLTIVIILILVCASLWIMYHLNYNMVH